jgi:hypothetical protein
MSVVLPQAVGKKLTMSVVLPQPVGRKLTMSVVLPQPVEETDYVGSFATACGKKTDIVGSFATAYGKKNNIVGRLPTASGKMSCALELILFKRNFIVHPRKFLNIYAIKISVREIISITTLCNAIKTPVMYEMLKIVRRDTFDEDETSFCRGCPKSLNLPMLRTQ